MIALTLFPIVRFGQATAFYWPINSLIPAGKRVNYALKHIKEFRKDAMRQKTQNTLINQTFEKTFFLEILLFIVNSHVS